MGYHRRMGPYWALRVWLNGWLSRKDRVIVRSMDRTDTTDRLVLVRAAQLDDLLELARLAAGRLQQTDPLCLALTGAIASIRLEATVEP